MARLSKWLKRTGYIIGAYLLYTIQRSLNNEYVKRAYDWGVHDGQKIERHNVWVKSNQAEKEIIQTKYERYAKVVE